MQATGDPRLKFSGRRKHSDRTTIQTVSPPEELLPYRNELLRPLIHFLRPQPLILASEDKFFP
jgi:hypothetical protein